MKIWIDRIIRSKTMWLAAILSVLGVVQTSTDVLAPYMSPNAMGVFTLIVGVLVALLRVVTNTDLKDK